MSHIAVIDIGKTNVKVALVAAATLDEVALVTCPNTVRPGPPYPHFDTEAHWTFVLDALRQMQAEHGVAGLVATTHGAAIVLLDAVGRLAAPILDYEHPGPDACTGYDALRPDFAETGSPRLPQGLNVGAQLHWQFQQDPGLAARVARIVTYPEYWAFRLSGVAAVEASSLGAHTDLWAPAARRPSALAGRLGIADRLAPVRRAGAALGPVLPEVAAQAGLDPGTTVHVGIHDSNASLYAHLVAEQPPFTVVSTGTWVIAMAVGGAEVVLDPSRDTLWNVNAFGDPVASARFMGGREHDLLTGGATVTPTAAELAEVLVGGPLLMPAAVNDCGPYQGRSPAWIGAEPPLGSGHRAAAVSLYLALVTAKGLDLIGHRGPVLVEGPFARNAGYLRMLATAAGSEVRPMTGATGTAQGAALLVSGAAAPRDPTAAVRPDPACAGYAARWRAAAGD